MVLLLLLWPLGLRHLSFFLGHGLAALAHCLVRRTVTVTLQVIGAVYGWECHAKAE